VNDKTISALARILESGSLPDPQAMERICEAVLFPEHVAKALRYDAAWVLEDAGRAAAASRYYRGLFVEGNGSSADLNRELLALGPEGERLAAVVYAGAIPRLASRYRERGIPADVLIDTVQDIPLWMETHRVRHGRPGLSELNWLTRHLNGKLFRLGRLQFEFQTCPFAALVFRNRETGEPAVLSEAGIRYRGDGQVDGTCGLEDPAGGWTSDYEFDGSRHRGHPISRTGTASPNAIELPGNQWELALRTGDPVLNVHIPEGGRMSPEACRDSYTRAIRFVEQCFPDKPFKAFACESWLLDARFRELLPQDSNIVRFQDDYYLLPVLADENQTLERVFGFGTKLTDLPSLAARTSLQKVVRDHFASGGKIHNFGGILVKEDAGR